MDTPNRKKCKGYLPKFQKKPVSIIQPMKNISGKAKEKLSDLFNLYLPSESYDEYVHFDGKLKAIDVFLSKADYPSKLLHEYKSFRVDVTTILRDKEFLSYWSEFLEDLINSPNLVIGLFGFAMDRFRIISHIEDDILNSAIDADTVYSKLIVPRFIGLQDHLSFQDLKMHNFGKFVTLTGTVVRESDVKPFCLYIEFVCVKCQSSQLVLQDKGCYTTPNICAGDGCFCRAFKPLLNSKSTQIIPKKNIRIQELNLDHNESGRVPRTVDCELTCDLTDSCMPGDTVVISGTVITSEIDEMCSNNSSSYVLCISANSVVCLKGKNVDPMDVTSSYFESKSDDLEDFKKLQSEKDLFRLIVASLCPNIYGHELIKAGLVLGLFGGGNRIHKERKKAEFGIRENSHILIVGDPGLGKSQMLLACANISPRGVYVCGNSTTSSGLTVTIRKEGDGENSLEAGALVLADQGHCCIDEFDKMVEQHSALLEAMEQQTISMAKSGVVCTLPARTSILAAANPSGGHYNKSKTVAENLRIGGSLLSRFDLVFIVQDEPDHDIDNKMSKHVMGIHTDNKIKSEKSSEINCFTNSDAESCSLSKRLKVKPNEKLNFISPARLQKYISHARKLCQPKLTPEVCEILNGFYLDMRNQDKLSYSTPITTRQLESLIRLTEARARTELRTFCTKKDAEDVIEIMKYSMRETYSDEFGNLDFNRSIHGSGMSRASHAKKLVNMMTRIASKRADNCFTVSEIQKLCNGISSSSDSAHPLIETLNDQGFLLKKGYQLYQLQTL